MSAEHQSEHAFVSTREAAERLGVSVRTVQLWVESGVLHAWKTAGGHRRIARESVEKVLAEQQAVIETASGLQPLEVVLIDDNPAQLKLYQLKLESLDLPLILTTTSDGLEGMMIIGQKKPRTVIVSLALANIDAVALIATVSNRLPATQIIALSDQREGGKDTRLGGLSERVNVLSAIDDLEAIGPLLSRPDSTAPVKRHISPEGTFTFEDDEINQLEDLTLTTVLRDVSEMEDRSTQREPAPTIGSLRFDSLVDKDY